MKLVQVLFLALISSGVIAQDTNVFESKAVGFKVTKPSEWQFVTAEENFENLKRIELEDEEFQQLMTKYSTVPLVVMMKYPEPFDDLNPSFKVNVRPLGQLDGSNPKQIIELAAAQLESVFQDFNLVQPPTDTTVAGLPAAYMRADYSLAIPDGRTFPTTSEMWIVPRGNYFFMIGAGTRQDEKTGTREQISKILSSIEM